MTTLVYGDEEKNEKSDEQTTFFAALMMFAFQIYKILFMCVGSVVFVVKRTVGENRERDIS